MIIDWDRRGLEFGQEWTGKRRDARTDSAG